MPAQSRRAIPTTKPAPDPLHALLIRHGKIVDGAGNGWFYGDILIQGVRIVDRWQRSGRRPAEEIDATG